MAVVNVGFDFISRFQAPQNYTAAPGDQVTAIVNHGMTAVRVIVKLHREAVDPPVEATLEDQVNGYEGDVVEHEGGFRRMFITTLYPTRRSVRMIQIMSGAALPEVSVLRGRALATHKVTCGQPLETLASEVAPYVTGQIFIGDSDLFFVDAVTIYICRIPAFAQNMLMYMHNPDHGVEVIGPNSQYDAAQYLHHTTAVYESGHVPRNMSAEARALNLIPDSHLTALAYVAIYCCVKSGAPQNIRLALDKRLQALKSALKLRDFDVGAFLQTRIGDNFLKNVYSGMAFFPNVKSIIFSTLLGTPAGDAFLDHLKMILKESQLTVFNLIVLFCTTPKLSALHIKTEVMDEYDQFSEAYRALVRRYGNCWPYCKLIHPEESIPTLNLFPNLAQAAKAFAYLKATNQTLKNLAGMREIPREIFHLASISFVDTHALTNLPVNSIKAKLALFRAPGTLDHINEQVLQAVYDRVNNGDENPEVGRAIAELRA